MERGARAMLAAMRIGRAWWGVVVILAGAALAEPPAKEKKKPPYLSPGEMVKRIEASPVQYKLAPLEELDVARGKLADELWPRRVPPIHLPKVERAADGTVTVTAWPEPPEAKPALAKAEAAFQQKDYAGAAAGYREALDVDASQYLVHAYLGDALFFGGDAKAALAEYDQAIALNPDDYRLYFFRASAHRELDHRPAMVDDLRTALTLNPRYDTLVKVLDGLSHGSLRIEPAVLVPRAFVRMEGDAVAIYNEPEHPAWFAWSICKGLWLGEKDHRREMLGTEKYVWSTTEELECLAAMLSARERAKSEGTLDDPRLDQLAAIVNDGLAVGLVLYELGSRVDPQVVLRVDAETRALVKKYVEKYVLVDLDVPAKPKKTPRPKK